ncbi:Zinc finger C2H2 [Penicillium longicatenatum]|uniref:Zinc finger C2H2 n=1 Tax=Penicillium longicatenatum TaxID=1561947 RepID=UPI002547FFA3|nr:Zinc finger C2H2 [Penicillium longicatenatum]KAJ5636749.1 Zinc finger C2H2 [Penicillium longicatenatum]
MDWSSYDISSNHWSNVPFASHSTAPESRSSIPQLIDSTSFSTCSSDELFPQNLLVQPFYDILGSNPLDVRHACQDHIESFRPMRNEYQHITMRDDLRGSTIMPKHPIPPCSACDGGQPWKTGTPSGLPNTRGRPERIDSLVCKWENCRKPPFQSKGALMRHINTQHVAPRSFKCPDQSCDRFFSRKDNMEEHVRRVHWIRVQGL